VSVSWVETDTRSSANSHVMLNLKLRQMPKELPFFSDTRVPTNFRNYYRYRHS